MSNFSSKNQRVILYFTLVSLATFVVVFWIRLANVIKYYTDHKDMIE
jgi:hypothetical protein